MHYGPQRIVTMIGAVIWQGPDSKSDKCSTGSYAVHEVESGSQNRTSCTPQIQYSDHKYRNITDIVQSTMNILYLELLC
jgi:hypothetical protein